MADALRSVGHLDENFGMLLGHTNATTTGRYGILPQGILADRVKMIEATPSFGYRLVGINNHRVIDCTALSMDWPARFALTTYDRTIDEAIENFLSPDIVVFIS